VFYYLLISQVENNKLESKRRKKIISMNITKQTNKREKEKRRKDDKRKTNKTVF